MIEDVDDEIIKLVVEQRNLHALQKLTMVLWLGMQTEKQHFREFCCFLTITNYLVCVSWVASSMSTHCKKYTLLTTLN